MARQRIKKTSKQLLAFAVAIFVLIAVVFIFTQPALSPGFDLRILGLNSSKDSNEAGSSFKPATTDPRIGQDVAATSFLIYDETSSQIIAERNPNTAVAIASITKLMTAYVVQKYGNLQDSWAIAAASTNGTRPVLGLVPGDKVIVGDLINAMLIGSANDAATALGEYLTAKRKQPIIELMNAEARSFNMQSTHYANPIGFDSEQNYSTANDLKLLLDQVLPLPLFTAIDRQQAYSFTSETGRSYTVKTTNELLADDPELHAIKTGYTTEAGGAMITAIYRDNLKFIIIVLGSPNREQDTKLLKDQVLKSITP